MTLKYTDTSHPLSSIAQGAIHTMICEYISEGAAGENPRDAFVPAEEKPFRCLVVSKRTGTGKLCFRSNIGEQSRRLEVVANSLAGDVWAAGDEIEVRVSSSVPVRKTTTTATHSLLLVTTCGRLKFVSRFCRSQNASKSNAFIGSPWPLSKHAKEKES